MTMSTGSPGDPDRMQKELERLQKALEEETGQRLELQRQLNGLNGEFEEFISTAAHDVREPLRDIAAYSQLLAETCAGRLDATALEFLALIQKGAAKIESVTSAVVDYWAAAGDRQSCRTDMEAVLRHALLVKEKQLLACSGTVTYDALPAVSGDFELLTKVLWHLIWNALEYSDSPAPLVHISCKRADATWVFSIADNGPGIDPAFHERIFGTFKRLHGKQHPGHGMGLAFCRKAIAWHGGKIWVESTPGSGSTFYFTLPPVD
jgi:light-regulated signal transduction histidine kinase (bacteriophytochrome)